MIGVCSAKMSLICCESLVDLEARLHEDQIRTLPLRRHRRHGRPDAEFAGFIARGRHDAPFAGSADGDRLATKIRVVPLLHGSVEGVHVDVDDLAVKHWAGRGHVCRIQYFAAGFSPFPGPRHRQ